MFLSITRPWVEETRLQGAWLMGGPELSDSLVFLASLVS